MNSFRTPRKQLPANNDAQVLRLAKIAVRKQEKVVDMRKFLELGKAALNSIRPPPKKNLLALGKARTKNRGRKAQKDSKLLFEKAHSAQVAQTKALAAVKSAEQEVRMAEQAARLACAASKLSRSKREELIKTYKRARQMSKSKRKGEQELSKAKSAKEKADYKVRIAKRGVLHRQHAAEAATRKALKHGIVPLGTKKYGLSYKSEQKHASQLWAQAKENLAKVPAEKKKMAAAKRRVVQSKQKVWVAMQRINESKSPSTQKRDSEAARNEMKNASSKKAATLDLAAHFAQAAIQIAAGEGRSGDLGEERREFIRRLALKLDGRDSKPQLSVHQLPPSRGEREKQTKTPMLAACARGCFKKSSNERYPCMKACMKSAQHGV